MKFIPYKTICKLLKGIRTVSAFPKTLYNLCFRARKIWWGTASAIWIINFILIGAKKLWTYRQDQLQAAQNQGSNGANENLHQQPQHNALQLNNTIHNQDVMSIKQDVLVCLVAVSMVLGTYIGSFLVDNNGEYYIVVRFFFNYNAMFLARAFLIPVIFFVMNKHARRHVKTTFWNEWAPDFIQVYNPNRVVEIELNNNPRIRV